MTQQQSNNALSQQLTNHFGLTTELFSAQSGFFFEGAQRRHVIETLRHMACFADMVLFLSGEKGSGKTSLLKRLQSEADDGLGVIYIDCEQRLKSGKQRPEFLLSAALVPLGLSEQKLKLKELFSVVLKACHRRLASEDGRTLIVFDNADKMPKKELQEYCSLCRGMQAESAMVLLFAGAPNLVPSTKAETNLSQDNWFHHIHLKPVCQIEIEAYLNQALVCSGYAGEFKLTDQQAQQLVELGKGLPGRINKLFPSVVLEPGSLRIKKTRSEQSFQMVVMLGLAGLLTFSFLVVSYQHGLFDSFFREDEKVGTNESPVEVVSSSETSEQLREDLEQTARIAMLDKMMQENGLQLSGAEEGAVVVVETMAEGETQNDSPVDEESVSKEVFHREELAQQELIVSQEPEEVRLVISDNAEKPAEISASAEVMTIPSSFQADIAKSIKSEISKSEFFRSKQWVDAQSKESYLPQILGSYSEETALKFINQVGKQKVDVFYLETEHKEKKWYVVFYGVYPAKLNAQDAVKNAPKIIKDQKPWIRRITEVLSSYPK